MTLEDKSISESFYKRHDNDCILDHFSRRVIGDESLSLKHMKYYGYCITNDGTIIPSNYFTKERVLNTLEKYSLHNHFCANLYEESLINCISVLFIGSLYNLEKYIEDYYSYTNVEDISFIKALNYTTEDTDGLAFDYFTITEDKYARDLLCL